MKIISTKTHGVLDYLVGFILIVSPWLLDFANGGSQMWIPIILGLSAVLYSIITNYELGIFKIISFKTHLIIDALSGILLASSPWIFGFADDVYMPHLLFGLLEIIVVIFTKTNISINLKNAKPDTAL
ncbi:MAG: SPW repeat protein [Segetibacter sp.]